MIPESLILVRLIVVKFLDGHKNTGERQQRVIICPFDRQNVTNYICLSERPTPLRIMGDPIEGVLDTIVL